MPNIPPFPPRPPFKPDFDSPCLCGSGERFQSCCSGQLPGIKLHVRRNAAIAANDWNDALVAARADLTQYTIFHLTNTAPLLLDKSEQATAIYQAVLEMDVQALSECVEMLRTCCDHVGAHDEVFAIFDRIQKNIDHPRWARRLGYLRCLHALSDIWDEDAGRIELAKLGSMAEETDAEILQLYLDLNGRELGLADTLKFIDRIIALCDQEGERLHYRSLKAITFLSSGDVKGARNELMEALTLYRDNAPESQRTLHGRQLFATSLNLAGILAGDSELLDEGAAQLTELLELDEWTQAGRAELLRQRGDAFRHLARWTDAKAEYLQALNIDARAISQVFIAQSTLFVEGPAAAVPELLDVDAAALSQDEYIDYVLVLANIAIESGDRELLVLADSLLRAVEVSAPYFRKQCDALLVSVMDTTRTGPTTERSNNARQLLSDMLFRVTRYVKLEPNLMGFGLNIGKMIDDANERYLKVSSKK